MGDTPMRDTQQRHPYERHPYERHAMRDTPMRGPRERLVHSIHILEALTTPRGERAVRTLSQGTQESAQAPVRLITARSSPL